MRRCKVEIAERAKEIVETGEERDVLEQVEDLLGDDTQDS